MAKKRRNSTKVRPQEYEDDYDRSYLKEDEVEAEPVKAPVARTVKAIEHSFREGHVVVCPDTSKLGDGSSRTGTIVQLFHGEAVVADCQGYLHRVRIADIYLAQN